MDTRQRGWILSSGRSRGVGQFSLEGVSSVDCFGTVTLLFLIFFCFFFSAFQECVTTLYMIWSLRHLRHGIIGESRDVEKNKQTPQHFRTRLCWKMIHFWAVTWTLRHCIAWQRAATSLGVFLLDHDTKCFPCYSAQNIVLAEFTSHVRYIKFSLLSAHEWLFYLPGGHVMIASLAG